MLTKKEIKIAILNYAYKKGISERGKKSPMGPNYGQFHIEVIFDELGGNNDELRYRIYEALHELFLQNLIMKDPFNESQFAMALTTKGVEIASKQVDIEEYSLRLENFVENQKLLTACQDDFNGGDLEKSVFSAFKLIEIEVRERSELQEHLTTSRLMAEAFNTERGALKVPQCETKSEEAGVANLFSGAMLFFRNPSAHRIVDYENPKMALRILMFAELLMELVGSSVLRQKKV